MEKILKNSWALFTGMGLIMLAHGFQVSLLGVRAVHESFSIAATGFMLTGYFVGYFIGARTVPMLVSRVGHIRVFAAFASIASIVVLVHSIIINPFTWFVLRVVSGFSMVCLYTIAESWLNDRASNKNRGSVLSIYMIVLFGEIFRGDIITKIKSSNITYDISNVEDFVDALDSFAVGDKIAIFGTREGSNFFVAVTVE